MTITEPALATERERLIATSNEAADTAWRYAEVPDRDVGDSFFNLTHAIAAGLNGVRCAILATIAPAEPGRETRPEVEEGWYVIELFGHRVRYGYVRAVQLGGKQLLEIREPEHLAEGRTADSPPTVHDEKVEFYSASSVFSLEPATEESVLKRLDERDGFSF